RRTNCMKPTSFLAMPGTASFEVYAVTVSGSKTWSRQSGVNGRQVSTSRNALMHWRFIGDINHLRQDTGGRPVDVWNPYRYVYCSMVICGSLRRAFLIQELRGVSGR